MRDYFKEWNNYFLDKKGNTSCYDKKDEINEVIDYIYKECEYSKIHFRYKDGIEIDYHTDLNRFEKNIKKYEASFIEFRCIRKPQRLSYIFAINYNYFSNIGLEANVINDIFQLIREEIFELKTAPKTERQRKEMKDNFEKMITIIPTILEEATLRFEKLRKENPNLPHSELLNLFAKTKN